MPRLTVLMREIRACRICEAALPDGLRPLVQGSQTSRVLIIGQAPGSAAHSSGVPWDDRSGDRLREWMGVSKETFHNERLIALMPMGFCYPGTGARGDLRPRPECAPEWHDRMLAELPDVSLTILTGKYAFDRYLSDDFSSITEASRAHKHLLPSRIALPHPSPRNNFWLKKNPWFESDVLPVLRRRIRKLIN
jgi:uracil-DNA glycosylase